MRKTTVCYRSGKEMTIVFCCRISEKANSVNEVGIHPRYPSKHFFCVCCEISDEMFNSTLIFISAVIDSCFL